MEEEIQKLQGKNNLKQVKVNKNELRELVKKELIVPYIDMRLNLVRTKLSVIAQRVVTPESPCERCKRCIKCIRCSEGARKKRELEMKMKQAKLDEEAAAKSERGTLKIEITKFTEDEVMDYVLEYHPIDLKPVVITHKKKVTVEDFNTSLDNLKADARHLNKASEVALSLAGLAKKSVEGFQSATHRAKLDPNLYTRAQFRWKTAIHKVILQNAVAMYTEQWDRSIHNPENHNKHGYTIEARQMIGSSSQLNRSMSSSQGRKSTNFAKGSLPNLVHGDGSTSDGYSTSSSISKYNKYGRNGDGKSKRIQSKSFSSICESPYFPSIDDFHKTGSSSDINTHNGHESPMRMSRATFSAFDPSSSVMSTTTRLSRLSFDSTSPNNGGNRRGPSPISSKLRTNALDVMSSRNQYTGGMSNEMQLEAVREQAKKHQRFIAESNKRANRKSFVWDEDYDDDRAGIVLDVDMITPTK